MTEPTRRAGSYEPATLLLHKPPGIDVGPDGAPARSLLDASARSAEDSTGIVPQRRHFERLAAVIPLEPAAAGMQVFTQDPRLLRRLRDDAGKLEQEFVVEVSGEIAPYGLNRLRHGLAFNGRNLPPISVSWQNETRLRFALSGVQPGQIASMCAGVGLAIVAMKRIRIGRIPLSKLAQGQWRYLGENEKL